MVRTLTTHRVFPARETGGNGIAGTAAYLVTLKRIRLRVRGCNEFRLCIKREGLDGFYDGVVVGPGFFEAIRKELNGEGAARVPDHKAERCSAESTDHTKNIFHGGAPLFTAGMALWFDASCGVGCDKYLWRLPILLEVFTGASGTIHFAYGFGSLWAGTGDWNAAGGKDSQGRDGCGDRSESFGEGGCGFAATCGE
jgi:hypothetical protein